VNPRLRAVAKIAVKTVNTPVAKARAARAIAREPRPVKLEIGGLAVRPGWLVTNVNATARNYLDATARWPFADGELECVYADNVIEHITLEQGRGMLREAHRCLQPGGTIRLVTPDLGAHIELYHQGASSVDSPAAVAYRAMGLTVEHPIDMVRIPIATFDHHLGYLYDYDTLAAELTKAGFADTHKFGPGESSAEVMRGLDKRAHEGGAQMAVEGTK
jgi:predicted SAM-dependent methyltransferase